MNSARSDSSRCASSASSRPRIVATADWRGDTSAGVARVGDSASPMLSTISSGLAVRVGTRESSSLPQGQIEVAHGRLGFEVGSADAARAPDLLHWPAVRAAAAGPAQLIRQAFEALLDDDQVGQQELRVQDGHVASRVNRDLRVWHVVVVEGPHDVQQRFGLGDRRPAARR